MALSARSVTAKEMNEEGRLSSSLSLHRSRHRSSAIIRHQRVGSCVCHAHAPTRLKQWALSNLLLLPWQVTGKVPPSPHCALFSNFVAGTSAGERGGGRQSSRKHVIKINLRQAGWTSRRPERGSYSVSRLFWRSIFELATFCCYFYHCCCCCCYIIVQCSGTLLCFSKMRHKQAAIKSALASRFCSAISRTRSIQCTMFLRWLRAGRPSALLVTPRLPRTELDLPGGACWVQF